ncbi:MAG: SOS response-associated peptidase [Phycisphaerales bacterium]|nr:SOS response-associated peptidase [Phycisphaerales bacterium]
MPGRFFLATPVEALAPALDLLDGPLDAARRASLAALPRLVPRYNIAPGQDIPIILPPLVPGERPAMKFARWGLIPHWSATPDVGVRTINIAAETIDDKLAPALRSRRCLVPADGFYEWRTLDASQKQPYLVRFCPPGERAPAPFVMAALWEEWTPRDGSPVTTVAILTTPSNSAIAPIHERMPAVVPVSSMSKWLGERGESSDAEVRAAHDLCRPYPAELTSVQEVSRLVNSTRFDNPGCIRPVESRGAVY